MKYEWQLMTIIDYTRFEVGVCDKTIFDCGR